MRTTKKKLTDLIRETVIRQLKEFHKNQHEFVYDGLEIGPLTVQFIHHPVRNGTLYQPQEGGDIEITRLMFNGKSVDQEQVAQAENNLIVPMGEDPLTGEDLMFKIQTAIEQNPPDQSNQF